MALFAIREGLKIFGSETEANVVNGSSDPSSTGVTAPQGSLYLKSDGISFKKTGPADTDWQPYSEIEGGGLLWSTISGAQTAEVSRGYILDSSSAVFTVTMPASPEAGDTVGFAGLSDIETNNITVDLNSLNMNGSADDLIIDLNYCYFEMLYTGDASTGWVLSNTDESGNIDNMQSFVGNDDNVDPAVTEFTEENYIVGGDSLEDAIDKIDMALNDTDATVSGNGVDIATNAGNISTNAGDISTNAGNISTNAGNISTNAGDITALETYTGSAGGSSPDYTDVNYVTDGDDLEAAIGKLDAALKTVSDIAATGVNWQETATAITADVINTAVAAYSGTDHFSDDDTPFWTHDDWADGSRIVSMDATTSGMIYTWNDGADQWVYESALGANDAISVQYDFPDAPGSQEDGAAYMMKEDESGLIKIADFDLETAASIAISSGYTAGAGTVSSTDSVESAIQKLDGNISASEGDITSLEGRVTTNEGDIITNASGIAGNLSAIESNDTDISNLDGRVTTNEGDIITNASGIATNASNISSNNTAISNNYTYITNVDTAHDSLAAAVLTETSAVVTATSSDTVLDTVTQAGNLGAKWFVVAYDGSGNRYAAEIYAMHDGSTNSDLTEYAILTLGTQPDVSFDIVADGTDMSLTVDNGDATTVTVKTQRISVQTVAVVTTAVIS